MKLDKWTVTLILGLTVIGVIVWLGIKNKWFAPRTELNLKAGEGDVEQDAQGNASKEYTRIAQNAHDQLLGLNWNLFNMAGSPAWEDVITQLYNLNLNELRVVVNEYDRLFSDSTLRSLINNENTGCWAQNWYTADETCYQYYEVKNSLNSIKA